MKLNYWNIDSNLTLLDNLEMHKALKLFKIFVSTSFFIKIFSFRKFQPKFALTSLYIINIHVTLISITDNNFLNLYFRPKCGVSNYQSLKLVSKCFILICFKNGKD